MAFSYRFAALGLVLLVGFFFLLKPARLENLSPLQYLTASGRKSPEILNGTLGVSPQFSELVTSYRRR